MHRFGAGALEGSVAPDGRPYFAAGAAIAACPVRRTVGRRPSPPALALSSPRLISGVDHGQGSPKTVQTLDLLERIETLERRPAEEPKEDGRRLEEALNPRYP